MHDEWMEAGHTYARNTKATNFACESEFMIQQKDPSRKTKWAASQMGSPKTYAHLGPMELVPIKDWTNPDEGKKAELHNIFMRKFVELKSTSSFRVSLEELLTDNIKKKVY